MICTALVASGLGAAWQWRFYRRTRSWWPAELSFVDSALLAAALGAVVAWPLIWVLGLALLLEGLGLGGVAWLLLIAGTSLLLVVVVLDLDSYAICGFHLVNYRSFITLENPARWIGGYRRVTPMVRRSFGAGLMQMALGIMLSLTASVWPAEIFPAALAVLGAVLASPAVLRWLHRPALGKRLLATTIHRPWLSWSGVAQDTHSQACQRLRQAVEQHSARFQLAVKPVQSAGAKRLVEEGRKTSVVLLVIDGWRADALTPSVMPRLWERSQAGFRAERHYSNGNATHTGMFALMYGRSPLVLAPTLRQRQAPVLAATLRARGYRSCVRGLQTHWLGLEQIFAGEHYDEVQNIAEEDDLAEADLQTLALCAQRLAAPSTPVLFVGHLLASHFPYYLPRGEQGHSSHLDEHWNFSGFQAAGLHAPVQQVWRERYRNSVGWLDANIDRLLRNLDLEKTLVVITGDHGESHGEDGTWLHASRLSEVQTRVPLVMLGAGLAPWHIERVSTALDVAPTIMELLGHSPPAGGHGQSLLRRTENATVHLCDFWQRQGCIVEADRQERLVLTYGYGKSRWSVAGFADARGELQPEDWAFGQAEDVWEAMVQDEIQRLTWSDPALTTSRITGRPNG